MAIMHPFGVIGVNDLPPKYRHVEVEEEFELEEVTTAGSPAVVGLGDTVLLPEGGIDLKEYISGLEQNLIQQALDNNAGVVARAAEQLSVRRTTLVEKMRKYGMQR
jgi:sigma-54 specific flagellar transcriptional regulator A